MSYKNDSADIKKRDFVCNLSKLCSELASAFLCDFIVVVQQVLEASRKHVGDAALLECVVEIRIGLLYNEKVVEVDAFRVELVDDVEKHKRLVTD